MRRWGIGTNSLFKTASYDLEEAPWWIFAIEYSIEWLCDCVPSIPFPDIKLKLLSQKDADDCNDGDRVVSMKGWYGDLQQWFCAAVHMSLTNWCYRKMEITIVNSTWDWMIEHHPEDMKRRAAPDEDILPE